MGSQAGVNLTTGSNDIDIGSPGMAGDSNAIRIGTPNTHKATFIAGIFGVAIPSGIPVVVSSNGQLGVAAVSSARFKRNIHDMGAASEGLMKLRPVTFRYRQDPTNTRQYGLVAEEVERIYPELVIYDADGKPEAVRYEVLTSMLLNEFQKQSSELRNLSLEDRRQAGEFKTLSTQLASDGRELRAIKDRLGEFEQAIRIPGAQGRVAAALSR